MTFTFPERLQMAQLPTPIQKLSRLSDLLGGPELYVKRDDLTGMGVSGNKVRKLEFTVARAMREGCDTLITCGGLQSNHARATAAVAARLGLKAHLVLAGERDPAPQGNYLLNLLFGAAVTYVPGAEIGDLNAAMQKVASEVASNGGKAAIIPLGASDATGALGYVLEAQEIADQCSQMDLRLDTIVVASGSAGTQAGLVIGKKLFGLSARIVGIAVRVDEAYFQREIAAIVAEFRDLYAADVALNDNDVQVIDRYVGAGYGMSQPDELRFIAQVARSEGLLVDPTYTGKALYGLCEYIKRGTFQPDEKILFIHTGGLYGLFPRGAEFAEALFD